MVITDIFYDLLGDIFLGPDFVIQIVPAKGGFENCGIQHSQVFLNVMLNFRSGSCGKGNDRVLCLFH